MYVNGLNIDLISDTHNRHKHFVMPGGDILIHAGDVSGMGKPTEILPFLDWFSEQDYSHLILIAGNHDWGFQKDPTFYEEECKRRNIILLNDSGYEAEGIKIWGSPVQPWFCNWAFNKGRGSDIKQHWDLIPLDTQILVTHGPPYLIGDGVLRFTRNSEYELEHVGCADLVERIKHLKDLKLHVCGHIHEGRGVVYENGIIYVNASALDERYQPVKGVPIRVVKDDSGQYITLDSATEDNL